MGKAHPFLGEKQKNPKAGLGLRCFSWFEGRLCLPSNPNQPGKK
jgi:hypothetical protein